jgi:hypothetical protein
MRIRYRIVDLLFQESAMSSIFGLFSWFGFGLSEIHSMFTASVVTDPGNSSWG